MTSPTANSPITPLRGFCMLCVGGGSNVVLAPFERSLITTPIRVVPGELASIEAMHAAVVVAGNPGFSDSDASKRVFAEFLDAADVSSEHELIRDRSRITINFGDERIDIYRAYFKTPTARKHEEGGREVSWDGLTLGSLANEVDALLALSPEHLESERLRMLPAIRDRNRQTRRRNRNW